jgi:hypothetical protein
MNKKSIFLLLFTICMNMIPCIAKEPASFQVPRITIWIHGTRGSAFLPIHASKKLTLVEQEVALCPQGLHRAADLPDTYHQRRTAAILNAIDPEQFPFQAFYCFGWSGDLDPQARIIAAQQLHQAIIQLIQTYKIQYTCVPSITLITHSHGGNVALNLVRGAENAFYIDRLILLACPVQEETQNYIHYPMFKKSYSLHSHTDLIQILDVQKLHPFKHLKYKIKKQRSLKPFQKALQQSLISPLFSKRHFKQSPSIIQAKLRWNHTKPWNEEDIAIFSYFRKLVRSTLSKLPTKRGLLHLEFLLPSFLHQLPKVIKLIDQQQPTDHDIEIRI